MYLKHIYCFYRTKVECGGQCLTNPACEAFQFVNNVCKLLRMELLFKDASSQTEVYAPFPAPIPGNN